MSSFDPITYSAVNQLKPFVGQPFLVSTNFINEKYVDTGQFIDPIVYPKLTANMAGNTNPIASTTTNDVSYNAGGAYGAAASTLGFIWLTFEYNNRLFVLFNNSTTTSGLGSSSTFTLCGTSNSDLSTMSIIRTIPYNTCSFDLPNGYKGPVNNRIYLSLNQIVDLPAFVDPNNANWLIDMQIAAPAASTTGWRIAFGNGVYVGASGSSTNNVIYSSDGINFQVANGLYVGNPVGICFGAGKFVIVTATPSLFSDNTIVYSTDGINWTSTRAANAGTQVPSNGFMYSATAGCFVFTCQSAAFYYQRSVDGITWTEVPISMGSGQRPAGLFLLPDGNFISSFGFYSNDGENWPNYYDVSGRWLNPKFDVGFNTQTGVNSARYVYTYHFTSFNYRAQPDQPGINFGSQLVVLASSFNTAPASLIQYTIVPGNQLYATTLPFPTGTWSTPTRILNPITTGSSPQLTQRTPIAFNGNTWMSLQAGSVVFNNPASTPVNNITGYSYGNLAGTRSTDGGQTWQNIVVSTPGYPIRFATFAAAGGKFHIMGVYESMVSGNIVYRAVIGTSTDGLNWTWSVQTAGQTTPSSVFPSMAVDKNGSTYYWIVSDQSVSRVVYSSDLGQSWQSFGNATGLAVQSIVPALNGAYIFYAGAGNMYWVSSSNVVRRFTNLPLAISSTTANSFGFNGNTLILYAGSSIMYYSTNNGTSWSAYTVPSPTPSSGVNITIVDNTVIFQLSTSSNTLYYTSLAGLSQQMWSNTTPYSGLSLWPLIDNNDDLGYYAYSSSSPGYTFYLKATPAAQATYFLPAMTSPITGAKWVVKAK